MFYDGLDFIDGHSLLEHEYVFNYNGPNISKIYYRPLLIVSQTNRRLGHTIQNHVHKNYDDFIRRCDNERNLREVSSFRKFVNPTLRGSHELTGHILAAALLEDHIPLRNWGRKRLEDGRPTPYPGISLNGNVFDAFKDNLRSPFTPVPTMGFGADCIDRFTINVYDSSLAIVVMYSPEAKSATGTPVGWYVLKPGVGNVALDYK